MYKVLIVEDEMLVRVGLKSSVDWAKFNMEVIADTADGLAGLDIYEKEKPDLIITDLKMPKMSGMELISKIREKDKLTRIVILSCIEEFEMARKAMSYGVTEYILKLTMANDDIERILEKVKTELDKQAVELIPKAAAVHYDNADKDGELKDFLFYGLYSNEEFEAYVGRTGLKIYPEALLLAVIEIDNYEKLAIQLEDNKGHLIRRTILNVLNELLDRRGVGEAFSESNSRYIIILNFKGIVSENLRYKELNSILDNIRDSMKIYFNVETSIGTSTIQNSYSSLKNMYIQAANALESKFYFGSGIFIYGNLKHVSSAIYSQKQAVLSFPAENNINNDTFLKEYEKKVDGIFEAITENKTQVRELFCDFVCWIAEKLYVLHADTADNIIDSCIRIKDSNSFREITDIIGDVFKFIRDVFSERKSFSREISAALLFIETNYSRELSLNEIAKHVNLSNGYFSGLFKKELGISFVEYLNGLRIEKAKELLVNTYLKAYEIAEMVGFGDETYFSRVFKKNTGMSVQEYRKKWVPKRKETS